MMMIFKSYSRRLCSTREVFLLLVLSAALNSLSIAIARAQGPISSATADRIFSSSTAVNVTAHDQEFEKTLDQEFEKTHGLPFPHWLLDDLGRSARRLGTIDDWPRGPRKNSPHTVGGRRGDPRRSSSRSTEDQRLSSASPSSPVSTEDHTEDEDPFLPGREPIFHGEEDRLSSWQEGEGRKNHEDLLDAVASAALVNHFRKLAHVKVLDPQSIGCKWGTTFNKNMVQARSACWQSDRELPYPKNSLQNAAIYASGIMLVSDLARAGVSRSWVLWLGLGDMRTEGEWYWNDWEP